MKEAIKNKIESLLAAKILSLQSVSGGCINDARIILTESQKKYFVKINYRHPVDMFKKEADGLKEIALSKTIRVPKVISVNDEFILLEVINSTNRSKSFFEDFGRMFAEMHKYSSDYFGFYEDNYIGSTPQINTAACEEKNNWTKFYFNKRLLYQIHLAERNGYLSSKLKNLFTSLESKIESILKTKDNTPSLLHGDLWGGNYIVDENGNACLIDPSVYYGHREADLAMTKLFGGFDYKFYNSYNEVFPLEDGYEYRENIYKLYHVLNHLNLFGKGYYQQVVNLIKNYL